MKIKGRNSGFTLIELVIVIVIIGILAAVAVPKFGDIQKNAQVASIKGTLASVRSALIIARGDNMLALRNQTASDSDAATNCYWPTLAEVQYAENLSTLSNARCPLDTVIPGNPFRANNNSVATVSSANARNRSTSGTTGWLYNQSTGIFYANSTEGTNELAPGGGGSYLAVNEL